MPVCDQDNSNSYHKRYDTLSPLLLILTLSNDYLITVNTDISDLDEHCYHIYHVYHICNRCSNNAYVLI